MEITLGIVRTVIAGLGGYLVAGGFVSVDQWVQISGGIMVIAAVFAWTIYHHAWQAPARIARAIIVAASHAAEIAAGGAKTSSAAAQGASMAGASDATVELARAATMPPPPQPPVTASGLMPPGGP
jgi:hypothetical protein